jgi:hypothetical protein
LEHVDWKIATGLDGGDSIETGHTTGAYSIVGYPTMLLLGRDGKIAFTTDFVPEDIGAHMKGMEELAKSPDAPWPPDKGLDKDADVEKYNSGIKDRLNKLLVAYMSKQLDAALKAGAE